jgi:hypothetical protein
MPLKGYAYFYNNGKGKGEREGNIIYAKKKKKVGTWKRLVLIFF